MKRPAIKIKTVIQNPGESLDQFDARVSKEIEKICSDEHVPQPISIPFAVHDPKVTRIGYGINYQVLEPEVKQA